MGRKLPVCAARNRSWLRRLGTTTPRRDPVMSGGEEMFDELSGHWVPLLPGSEISRRPRRLVVASVPLVVWRTGDGRVGVLHDQCPHRGTALSLGRVTAEGSLECGFHGWRFDAGGSCLAVPFNPRADVGRLAATAFPVTEAAGLAWIHTSSDAVGRPGYDPALDEPDLARQVHWEEWDCHWTRAMENMLDFPHLPFVHRTTIGMFLRRVMRPDSEMTIAVEESANGFVATSRVDGRSTGAVLRWHAPAGMSLDIGPPGRTLVLNVWCVPSDRNRTRMILCAVRDFARDPLTAAAWDAPTSRCSIKIVRWWSRASRWSCPILASSDRCPPTTRRCGSAPGTGGARRRRRVVIGPEPRDRPPNRGGSTDRSPVPTSE